VFFSKRIENLIEIVKNRKKTFKDETEKNDLIKGANQANMNESFKLK
jgi:hypothetical protein